MCNIYIFFFSVYCISDNNFTRIFFASVNFHVENVKFCRIKYPVISLIIKSLEKRGFLYD